MFQELYDWIQNITVYLLVTAAVMHAIPGKDYGKYIRFFSGLILILLLASPILNLTGMSKRFRTLYQGNEYEMNRREIEKAEEFYKNLGITGLDEGAGEGDTGGREIEVGEIEIGQ